LDRYADVFGIRASTLMRFSEEYEGAVEQNRAQLFITNMMSKLIEFYGERYEASD
jgi:hypothetical protein